jgi:pimeloyl-ACP methyl ester carboxylesterase
MKRTLIALATLAVVAIGLPASTALAATDHASHRPVIFVHGSTGSASQYETQARRFASNGYDESLIEGHDYDSTFATENVATVFSRLDQRIARLLAETGADRVDLVAHSLGTFLSQSYLSNPARAATVAHYVNLDGASAAAPPGGVPTLAIWGEGPTTRAIGGATNVYLSGQSHTQTVTSPESFLEQYRFFNDAEPATTELRLDLFGTTIAGRAVLFPINAGVTGATLQVWEVGPLTGRRLHSSPAAEVTLGGDGSWGPLRANPLQRYEFVIVRDGAANHHFYYQPFRRSDHLIRLQTSLPGQGLSALMDVDEAHSNLTVTRFKEWWGDQPEGNDQLFVNGVNVLTPAIAPRAHRPIGIFLFDQASDRVTHLDAPIPAFFSQPFLTAADVFIPARPRNLGLIFITVKSRTGGVDFINLPNWPSTTDRSTIQVNDFD